MYIKVSHLNCILLFSTAWFFFLLHCFISSQELGSTATFFKQNLFLLFFVPHSPTSLLDIPLPLLLPLLCHMRPLPPCSIDLVLLSWFLPCFSLHTLLEPCIYMCANIKGSACEREHVAFFLDSVTLHNITLSIFTIFFENSMMTFKIFFLKNLFFSHFLYVNSEPDYSHTHPIWTLQPLFPLYKSLPPIHVFLFCSVSLLRAILVTMDLEPIIGV